MEQYDVTALGELLIDFTENGTSCQGNPRFTVKGKFPVSVIFCMDKRQRGINPGVPL